MSDLTVAKTILQQLGGNKFIAMTGAKNFVGDERSLSFMLPGNFAAKRIRGVRILLHPSDTYTVEFNKMSKGKIVNVSTHYYIYDDQLQELFTRVTGLNTHL